MLDKKREEILETDIGSRHYPGKTRTICKENISVVLKYLFKSKCRKVSYSYNSWRFLPINLENEKIENVESKKLLGPAPDDKTVFYTDLPNICNHLTKDYSCFREIDSLWAQTNLK